MGSSMDKEKMLRLPAKMEAQVDTLCLLAQAKERQQQFKNKKQPELTENRTLWKSNNQGNKEETFTQQVGGAETGSRQTGHTARWQLVDPARWRIVEGGRQSCSWQQGSSWQTRRQTGNPGLQLREIKPQTTD